MSEIPPRLLRDTLHGQASGSSSGCLDADTLAAWADGTLGARARSAVEAHASSCARCQALLAAMVKAAPAAASPAAWWRSWKLAWLAPIAAAATAVVLWIGVPGSQRERRDGSTATSAAKKEAPTSVAAVPVGASAAAPPLAARSDLQARAKEAESSKVDSAPTLVAANAPRQEATADQRDADQVRAAASEMRVAAAAPSSTLPDGATLPASSDAPAQTLSKVPTAPSNASDASRLRAPGLNGTASDQAGSRRALAPMPKTTAVPEPELIVSPDPSVRWRIMPAGGVARTSDGGTTWQDQSTGTRVALSAGAAPSPTVCWLVGPGGIVVLSTDGHAWQRVTSPATVDLLSIRASDAANATVTAVDGRTFSTTDGGKAWR